MRPGIVWGWILSSSLVATTLARAEGSPWLDDFTIARGTGAEPLGSALTPALLAETPAAPPSDRDQVGGGRMERRGRRPKPAEQPRDTTAAERGGGRIPQALTGERARILLQSLTVPGWGQASMGRRTAATVFALTEVGIWTSFTAFRVQQHLRRLSSERTAELFAGIDLEGRDEEYRRIVGSFPSSDDYNRLVVYRDAANQFMLPGHEDPVRYREYIDTHSLKGADTWAWDSEASYERYRRQRKQTQRAGQRANTALAVAMGNRLFSAIHAARGARRPAASPRSWNLECVPAGGGDPTAFHLGVRARF